MSQNRIVVNCAINRQLDCLYNVAELIESNKRNIESMLDEFIIIVANSMQFPERTSVEIVINENTYKTKQFRRTKNCITQEIFINENKIGTLSVFIDNKTDFSEEDKILIIYLCERIGRVVHRYKLLEDLNSVRNKLEIQNEILKRKNYAMSEILSHIEDEKQREKQKIMENLEVLVFPIVDKMKQVTNPTVFIDLLEEALYEISSSYGLKLKKYGSNLTPKEIEICNLIRTGKTSKDIGHILNLSYKTINKHRDNIRIKFGIKNQGINLISYLTSMEYPEIE